MTKREELLERTLFEEQIKRELEMGIIHRNMDGKIKKSILLPRDITNGCSRRIQAEGSTPEECAKKLAKKYREIIDGAEKAIKPKRFGEVAEEWYNTEVASSSTSEKNKSNYRTILRLHIIPVFENQDITQLLKKDFQAFLNRYENHGESSVKKLKITLQRIIDYAMENRYMPYQKITLTLPKMKPIEKREILTNEQIVLLVKAQKEYHPAWVFLVMLATGLRPSELFRIRYTDVDFDKKWIHVKESKTGNGIRVIPLPQYIVDIIEADRKSLNDKGIFPEYVFHQSTNPLNAHTATTLNMNWHTALRKMDILNGAKLYRNQVVESTLENGEKLTPYNLRHTYCTMLNDCEIGEYFKKRLMGHTLKDSITDSVYTHSSDERIAEAAKPFLNYIQQLFDNASK